MTDRENRERDRENRERERTNREKENTDRKNREREARSAGLRGSSHYTRTEFERKAYEQGKNEKKRMDEWRTPEDTGISEGDGEGFLFLVRPAVLNFLPLTIGCLTARAFLITRSESMWNLYLILQMIMMSIAFAYIYTLPLYYYKGKMKYFLSINNLKWKGIYSFIYFIQILAPGLAMILAFVVFNFDDLTKFRHDQIMNETVYACPGLTLFGGAMVLFFAFFLYMELRKRHNPHADSDIPLLHKWIYKMGESAAVREVKGGKS